MWKVEQIAKMSKPSRIKMNYKQKICSNLMKRRRNQMKLMIINKKV